jgi:hypothetical protein
VNVPAADAHIVEYQVDKASPRSGYETGSLHILYSDKTEVVAKVVPKRKSNENSIVLNEEGIAGAKVAEDKRTIAWTEQFDNYGTSYSVPLVLAVYRSGKNIVEIQQGQMIWRWRFVDGGKLIAAVWGPVHFSDVGDYQLYDAETGRMLDEVVANAEVGGKNGTIHDLGPDAPAWAKELEGQKSTPPSRTSPAKLHCRSAAARNFLLLSTEQ